MRDDIQIATMDDPGSTSTTGGGDRKRIGIQLGESEVARVVGVLFMHDQIVIKSMFMGVTHTLRQSGQEPQGLSEFLRDPAIWASSAAYDGRSLWTPPRGGVIRIAGDQSALIRNDTGQTITWSTSIFYVRERVAPEVWALIRRRTVLEQP